ncbi:hypothetical protein QCA50_001055 [Cerrena zonata]|uniref:Cytochrome P450 n=1 Tax=Cerrena zonata TaxID=2478898 RepID=A0AAW0GUV6_9APHY
MAVSLSVQLGVLGVALWALRSIYLRLIAPSPLANLPGPPRNSYFFGNLPQLFNRYAWDFHREIIHKYGAVTGIHGLLGQNMLYVFDPKALHSVIVKDQYVYEESPLFMDFNRIFFGDGLLSSLGDVHRHQRKILNPVFNINHMRYMTPIFYQVTHKLRDAIVKQVKTGDQEIDMLNWMTRTALELVGQGGLGWSFDSLEEPGLNPLAELIKSLVPTVAPLFLLVRFIPFFSRIGSASFRKRVVESFPNKRVRKLATISEALDTTAKEILHTKRAALAAGDQAVSEQIGQGKDIMSVLLKAQMTASAEDKMPDNELLGHINTLIFAAMETTSGALARILNKLAEHQDVQDKLREEVIAARGDREEIPYDELVSLPFMEAVCRETLRLYPPPLTLNRKTREDIVMPLSAPIRGKDGKEINEIPVPAGTDLMIGIWASNINPAVWGEDAEVYKPERWLKPLPESVTEARVPGVYSNLMTFLGGGRACIGFKFSQLEMKVVLSVLVEHLKFELPKEEIYWNTAGIQFPTLGRESDHSQLPLKVSLVKSA